MIQPLAVNHKPINPARHVKVSGKWWRLFHFLMALREGQYQVTLHVNADGVEYTLWTPQENRTTY